jgi:hypothetical protein
MPATHPARLVAAALTARLAALTQATATPPQLTAARYWRPPTFAREALPTTPAAIVYPVQDLEQIDTRSTWSREIGIDLALCAAVANVDPATIDPLLDLAEDAITLARKLTDANGHTWLLTARETLSLADPETLARGAWFFIARLTYSLA